MKKYVSFKMSIPGDTKYLATVGNTFQEFFKNYCESFDKENDLGFKINLVLTEAVANAISHGHEQQCEKVLISAKVSKKFIKIEVKDYGKGFDLPDSIENEPYDESGRGIYIIRQIMDKVNNIRNGNSHILIMEKIL